MKTRLPFSILFASLALVLPTVAAPPTIIVSTPALNLNSNILIVGTATDTAEVAATDGRAALAGIKEVRYNIEGSRKWRKAQLTGKNASSTAFIIPYENKSAVGKRISIYAVDRSGNGSAISSIRFKRSTDPVPAEDPAEE